MKKADYPHLRVHPAEKEREREREKKIRDHHRQVKHNRQTRIRARAIDRSCAPAHDVGGLGCDLLYPDSSSSSPACAMVSQPRLLSFSSGRPSARGSRCSWPSRPHNVSCPPRPWLRTVDAASRSRPSISPRGPCRPDLWTRRHVSARESSAAPGGTTLTKGDARVLFSDIFALLVGEEHVSRETTLRRIRVWKLVS